MQVEVNFWDFFGFTIGFLVAIWALMGVIGAYVRLVVYVPYRTNHQNRTAFLNVIAISSYITLFFVTLVFYFPDGDFWKQTSPLGKEMLIYSRIAISIAWGVIVSGFLCKAIGNLVYRLINYLTKKHRQWTKYENKTRLVSATIKSPRSEYIISGYVARETDRAWHIEDDEGRYYKIRKSRIGQNKYGVQSLDVVTI